MLLFVCKLLSARIINYYLIVRKRTCGACALASRLFWWASIVVSENVSELGRLAGGYPAEAGGNQQVLKSIPRLYCICVMLAACVSIIIAKVRVRIKWSKPTCLFSDITLTTWRHWSSTPSSRLRVITMTLRQTSPS